MEMDNLNQQELDKLLKGAVLVRESRSGATQNYQLQDGTLIEVYYCQSGRVQASPISQVNTSLAVRYS